MKQQPIKRATSTLVRELKLYFPNTKFVNRHPLQLLDAIIVNDREQKKKIRELEAEVEHLAFELNRGTR